MVMGAGGGGSGPPTHCLFQRYCVSTRQLPCAYRPSCWPPYLNTWGSKDPRDSG